MMEGRIGPYLYRDLGLFFQVLTVGRNGRGSTEVDARSPEHALVNPNPNYLKED